MKNRNRKLQIDGQTLQTIAPAQQQSSTHRLFLQFAIFIFQFLIANLFLQSPSSAKPPAVSLPLTAELSSQSPKAIVGRAMPTVWDIRKFQPGIMEGRFEFRVGLKADEFYRYTTDEIVLSNDEAIYRWLFPPVVTEAELEEVEIRVTWVGKSGRIELPIQRLIAPTTAPRTVMIGVGEHRVRNYRTTDWEARLALVKLESIAPARPAHFAPAIQSVVVSWDSTNCPSDPFTFAAYDLIALSSEVFAQLRPPQLEAIAAWVLAGGRLYLEPLGMMDSAHVDFLNRLAPAASGPSWRLDRVGKLEWPTVHDRHLVSAPASFGRVLLFDPTEKDLEPQWEHRRALWQIPEQLPGRFVPWFVTLGTKQGAGGQLYPGSRVPDYQSMQNMTGRIYNSNQQPNRLTITERALQSIVAELMPTTVRVMPLRTIILLLAGLVMLIGPLDWWVLGRLRLRRFTWISWPLSTVLMTALLVALSNAYLKSTDKPRSLVLHDLGSDGRVVRSNRFRLEFPRQSRDILASLRQSLWMPLRASMKSIEQLGQLTTAATDTAALPNYQGRFPSRFEARQSVKQWTPHLSRQFTFGDPDAAPPIDWDQVPLAKYRHTRLEEARVPDSITQTIRSQLGEQAMVAVFHESGRWSCDDSPLWTAPRRQTAVRHEYGRFGQIINTTPVESNFVAPTMLSDLLWRLTVPRGGQHNSSTWAESLLDPHLRDVPLLRPDQRDLRALVVVVPGDEETVVYRRWIAGPPPPPPPQPPKTGPTVIPPQFAPPIPPRQPAQGRRFQQLGPITIQTDC